MCLLIYLADMSVSGAVGIQKDRRRLYVSYVSTQTMAFFCKHLVGILFIYLMTIMLCTATIQSVMTKYTANKRVLTSYTTLQKMSKVQCVERCNKEKQSNGCNLAGYNRVTKSCYLSVDGPQEVLDTADETFGVFFYEPGQSGIFCIISFQSCFK